MENSLAWLWGALLSAFACSVLSFFGSAFLIVRQIRHQKMMSRIEEMFAAAWLLRRRVAAVNAGVPNTNETLNVYEDDFRLKISLASKFLSPKEIEAANRFLNSVSQYGVAIYHQSEDKMKLSEEARNDLNKLGEMLQPKLSEDFFKFLRG